MKRLKKKGRRRRKIKTTKQLNPQPAKIPIYKSVVARLYTYIQIYIYSLAEAPFASGPRVQSMISSKSHKTLSFSRYLIPATILFTGTGETLFYR